ncbi:MAG: hypothetical protein GY807_15815 [Gammaproteobacteria bacterium]|nr:hypothetical protein [Gammaproteobacteria bacterium]
MKLHTRVTLFCMAVAVFTVIALLAAGHWSQREADKRFEQAVIAGKSSLWDEIIYKNTNSGFQPRSVGRMQYERVPFGA